jgi:hypothetical protein
MADVDTDDVTADHVSDDNTVATLIISDNNLMSMYYDIIQASPITIERKGMHLLRGKLKPIPTPPGHEPKAVLPISGSEITLRSTAKSNDKLYYISVKKSERKTLFGVRVNEKRNGKDNIELNLNETELILKSLRLVQLVIVGVNQRKGEEQFHPLLQDVFEICKNLEEIFDGHKDRKINALRAHYITLHAFLSDRFKNLINTISTSLTGNTLGTNESLNLGLVHDKMYFRYDDSSSNYSLDQYLGQPPDYDTSGPLQDAIKQLVKEFLWNKSMSKMQHKEASLTNVQSYPFPYPMIPDLKIEPDPYEQSIDLCNAISESNRRLGNPDDKLSEVQKILDSPLNLGKIINHKPQDVYAQLNRILLDGNHRDLIHQEIQTSLPNMLPEQGASEEKKLIQIFVKTQLLRSSLKTIHTRIEMEQNNLAVLETRKESSVTAHAIRPELTSIQSEYSKVKSMNFSRLEEAQNLSSTILERLEVFKKDRDKRSSGFTKEESVLWIGLGQGGGQILRECLMYCLDNMTDSRAMSLLYALGIRKRQKEISQLLERLYSQGEDVVEDNSDEEKTTPKTPGDELARIFSEELHVLAMNLGDEVLDLTRKEVNPKSYFVWGETSEIESDFEVERHTTNTLKLDRKQVGAGGATGIGRAFGFAREKQIRKVIREVAGKGGREPKHIVITHSLAGGSGSGMVLPVLEYVRNEFGPEAMIWVMSVGAGAAERRESDKYNTTFILSDILQSHYNGIHMPVNPIDHIEWDRFKDDISSAWDGLEKANIELLEKLGMNSLVDTGSNFLRNRLEIKEKVKSLSDSSNDFCPQKRSTTSFSGEEITVGFKEDIPPVDTEFEDGQIFDVNDILSFIPVGEESSKAFESWCWYKTRTGNRPALDFWTLLTESLQDPLAYAYQGDKRKKKSKARQDNKSIDDFVPSLTSEDLTNVLKGVEISLTNNWISKENEAGDEQKPLLKAITLDGLNGLKDLIVQTIIKSEDDKENEKWWATTLGEFTNVITKYSSHLSSYNSLKVDFVNRIRTFSGAGKDDRIRNIVVSNAHLERGVDQSDIKTTGRTYTVYNSVLFDMMMNIIGTRIDVPIHSSGESSSAEKFDDQDLIQNTIPPLVVGLVEMNDSKTMAESPKVRPLDDQKMFKIITQLDKYINRIFTYQDVYPGLENPLGFIPRESFSPHVMSFVSAYFGTRIVSILQHDPYDIMNNSNLCPADLQSYSTKLIEAWDGDSEVFAISKEERTNLLNLTGITSYHIANLYKWFSVIDCDLLTIFLDLYKINTASDERESYHDNTKFEIWRNNFSPEHPGEFDGDFIFESNALNRYRALGNDFHPEAFATALLKMGIWNDDVLRSLSPAYLNTYMPVSLLSLIDDSNEEIALIKDFYIPKKTDGFNHIEMDLNLDLQDNNNRELVAEINKHLSRVNLQMNVGVKIIKGQKETEELHSTLTLTPQLRRYLSAVRDVPSPNEEKLLPVKSPSANLARYLLPDIRGKKVENSRPIFTKAADSMKYLRYNALLPDEDRLTMGSLLRILLLTNSGYESTRKRLQNHCKIEGLNFEDFSIEIKHILEREGNVYSRDMISNSESSNSVCLQATVLRKRILSSYSLSNKILNNLPEGWSRQSYAIDYWKKYVDAIYGEDLESEAPLENYNPMSLKLDLIRSQNFITKNLWTKKEENDLGKRPIQHIQRLIFDICSKLGESLLQSEYMGSSDLTSRVHFNMTGFSDELIGRPSGVLTLVHSSDNSEEQGDTETDAVRNSIEDCIGFVGDCKEFFFQAPFGPRCSVTITMQQAPSAEISNRYTKLMTSLSGNDKFKYNDVAKLHPYAFLYNVLWMSNNVHKWTHSANVEYISKFIIPSDVIEHHFTNVRRVLEMVERANSHYDNISVDFPSVDIALLDNVLSENPKPHRNIIDLIGVMAIRHMKTAEGEVLSNEWETAGLGPKMFSEMYQKYRPEAIDEIDKQYLVYRQNQTSGRRRRLGARKGDQSDSQPSSNNDVGFYNIEKRCIAWFKAYKNWEEARDSPKPETNPSDGMSGDTFGE